MSVAQGQCPSCGAPMTFGVGSSIAQVCKYCRHCVVRSDRGLENLGQVADLANTPSLLAVDDEGSIDGRSFHVMGRVQLDHGAGPWDEWYIAFQGGTWAWVAYAQGNWYVTSEIAPAPPLPDFDGLVVEVDVPLGSLGRFRVIEKKRGTIVSGEGELPFAVKPGQTRFYVDVAGVGDGFGTLDFGDRSEAPQLFLGKQVPEGALTIRAKSERAVSEVAVEAITCPSCGGNIPALAPGRSERLGCPYCGAVSEIAARRVLEQQQAARSSPDLPLGSRGTLGGQEYVVCGFVERSATIEGEWFGWQEYLLFAPGLGFRWVVKDEAAWVWITPLNIAEIDLSSMPRAASWNGKTYRLRNHNQARVDYVLGEFYWKVSVGETVDAMDFVRGGDVLSRERMGDEVAWSVGAPVEWSQLADAFSLPRNGAGARFAAPSPSPSYGSSGDGIAPTSVSPRMAVILAILVVLLILWAACDSCGGCGGGGGFFGGYGTTSGSRGGK